jgi:hypothetical protein
MRWDMGSKWEWAIANSKNTDIDAKIYRTATLDSLAHSSIFPDGSTPPPNTKLIASDGDCAA